MPEETLRPAWSQHFTPDAIKDLTGRWTACQNNACLGMGGSTGKGVRVAVVDSGVEHDHPALEGCVRGGVIIEYDSQRRE